MEIKELHEKYKLYIKSIFSEQFKSDLVDVAVSVYGEEFRDKFKANIEKIIIHPKFSIGKILDFKAQQLKDLKLEAQKQLLQELKSTLSKEDAQKLQDIIDKYKPENDFFNLQDVMDAQLNVLFGYSKDDGLDFDILVDLIEKYGLNSLHPNIEEIEDINVKRYFETIYKIEEEHLKEFIEESTNYKQFKEEFVDVELKDFSLSEEVVETDCGFIALKNKKTGEIENHILINPIKYRIDGNIFLGKLVHEVLHALENSVIEVNGEKQIRTGFIEYDDENTNRDVSECIHTVILRDRIYPALRKMGYNIDSGLSSYAYRTTYDVLKDFYKKFEIQILRSRCQENLQELYNVVGKANFDRLVEVHNSGSREKMMEIVADMEKYSLEHMPERIGKYTLPVQSKVQDKAAVSQELNDLMEQERGELSHAD